MGQGGSFLLPAQQVCEQVRGNDAAPQLLCVIASAQEPPQQRRVGPSASSQAGRMK